MSDKESVLHKEIDIIQQVINRMANNSFLLKGWLISIIVAVLALTKDTLIIDNVTYFALIFLLPLLAFWYLDAFFLHKETCYRKLYDWVITHRKESNAHEYSLDYTRFKDEVDSIGKIMFSKTLLFFYGTVAIILIMVIGYNLL